MTVTRLGWAAYATALATLVADQLSKWALLGPLDLAQRGQIPLVPPLLNLTFVPNYGVSFGLLRGGDLGRWALSLFSLVVAVALAEWARRAERAMQAAGIGLIIGGALGNAVDRLRLGHVTDFLDVSQALPFFPWVFNLADSAITVGVALLLLESALAPKKPA